MRCDDHHQIGSRSVSKFVSTPVYEADSPRCFHCDVGQGGNNRRGNSRNDTVDKSGASPCQRPTRRTKSVRYKLNPWPLKCRNEEYAADHQRLYCWLMAVSGLRFRFLLLFHSLRQPQDVPKRRFTTTTRTGCTKRLSCRSSRTADSSFSAPPHGADAHHPPVGPLLTPGSVRVAPAPPATPKKSVTDSYAGSAPCV